MQFLENYKILSLSHHNVSVEDIGNFVINHNDDIDLSSQLSTLCNKIGIEELLYLSTCNRITFLFTTNHILDKEFVKKFFDATYPSLSSTLIEKACNNLRFYSGKNAIKHIFQVAASMDSLVVGEREIFHQYRQAYDKSFAMNLIGDNIRLLNKFVVTTAKEVYAKTKIGEKPLSIVSLAMQELHLRSLPASSTILMIGAGETNNLVAKYLQKYDFYNVLVFNRSKSNGDKIAEKLSGHSFVLDQLKSYAKGFDIIIICTGSIRPIITKSVFKQLSAGNAKVDKKRLIIDLSVPRNVSKEVINHPSIEYVDIDKLKSYAAQNYEHRKKEMNSATIIIEENCRLFQIAHQTRQLEKLFKHIPEEMKLIKQKAIKTVYANKIESLDTETQSLVFDILNYMEKNCISIPMKAIKKLVPNQI